MAFFGGLIPRDEGVSVFSLDEALWSRFRSLWAIFRQVEQMRCPTDNAVSSQLGQILDLPVERNTMDRHHF
jgi:hypothetical protein